MKKAFNWIGSLAVAFAAVGIVCPQTIQAAQAAVHAPSQAQQKHALRVIEQGMVQLRQDRSLQGVMVEASGKPVDQAPVALVRGGQVVGETKTGADGRFEFSNVPVGECLIATYDGLNRYQVVDRVQPGVAVKQGAVIKVDGEVARGQLWNGMSMGLVGTLLIAGVVAAVIIASDDDDDSAS